jgi:hypothetical protein
MLNKFGKRIKSKVKTKLRRNEVTPINGLPAGLDFETVSKICATNFGEFLQGTSYVHVSGWPQADIYRLHLATKSERVLQLIYKEVMFDEQHIPVLSNIKIVPGPPECAIFRSGSSQLLRYLPAVYLCDELTPRKHYRYIFEDLDSDYREPTSKDDLYLLTRQLPKIHLAFREWLESGGEDELIRYEGAFLESLHEFILGTIDTYVQTRGSEAVKKIQSSWKRITQLLNRKNFFEFIPMRPVHGDFNMANIRIHKENMDDIKLINWDWAGIGIPHADLAALLKSAPKHVEEEALDMFIRHIKGWTSEDQIMLYWSCKLERSLFDAAILIAEEVDEPGRGGIDNRKRIEHALECALDAYQNLG